MIGILAVLGGVSLAAGAAAGFGTYELFSHIMPRETGVPLGCVFGTLVGIGVAGGVFAKIVSGVEMP